MSKNYYEIECKDGIKRQAIEVMKKANMYAECRLSSRDYAGIGFIAFCVNNAFKYIARKGRKEGENIEKEESKIKDYCKWAVERGNHKYLVYLLEEYCNLTELGEELKKYFDKEYYEGLFEDF